MRLKQIITLKKGKKENIVEDDRDGVVRYLQIEDLRSDDNLKYCNGNNHVLANKDDVLIAWDGANAGTIGTGLSGAVGSTLAILRPTTESVYSDYLAYFLKAKSKYLRSRSKGATIPHISREALDNLDIQLPVLETQKSIAKKLDLANQLILKRQQSIQKLDELLQSVFYDMFGDFANIDKSKLRSLDEVSIKITDGEHSTPRRTSEGIYLLSARNIKNGYIDLQAGVDYIPEEEYERISKRCKPEYGDILVSCSGTIGRVTQVKISDRFSLVRSVALIKPNNSLINSTYLEYMLLSPHIQKIINNKAHGGSQANLFTGMIKTIPVYVPDMKKQKEFSSFAEKYISQKKKYENSQKNLESLFQSLLHQSFNGDAKYAN